MLNLAMMLEESAATLPGRDALVAGDTRLTYQEVNAAANQVAHLLRSRGIGRGAKVALAPVNPVVLYTSGTTGTPKGAELTHANMVMNALTCHKVFGTVEHDVHLVTLPLFHSFGQSVQLNAGFGSAATLVLVPRFDARTALSLMQSE